MFARSAIIFVFFALCGFVAAFPPACVLGAVITQKDLSDFGTLCGSSSNAVQKQIVKLCEGDSDAGLKSFKAACSDAGYDINLIDTNTSSSSSATSTASSTGSLTTSKSSPTSASGSGLSPSNTSSPSSEPNAGSLHKADSMFVALVVAIIGAIAL
ncbi:hypothetical protein MauCBS54593_004321 [Microsporum audouinii]